MQVRLDVSHKKANVKRVVLSSNAVIGRSTACNLRIASRLVSRQHCRITLTDSGVLVCDLDSSNGTFVDGNRISPHQEVAISPGSLLSIGGVKFVVRFDAPAAAAGSSDAAGGTSSQASAPPPAQSEPMETIVVDPGDLAGESGAETEEAATDGEPADASAENAKASPTGAPPTEEVQPEDVDLVDDAVEEVEIGEIDVDAADVSPADIEKNGAESEEQPTSAKAEKKGKLRSLFGKWGRRQAAGDEQEETEAEAAHDSEPGEEEMVEPEMPDEVAMADAAAEEEETPRSGTVSEVSEKEDVSEEDVSEEDVAGFLSEAEDDGRKTSASEDNDLGNFLKQFEKEE